MINYKHYFQKGISFQAYLSHFEKEATTENHEFAKYLPLNLSRTQRILKRFSLSENTSTLLSVLKNHSNWLLVTEDWCGDSAQVLPVIAKIAEESKGKIKLRILYRDEQPKLIDAHLTNNGRAIPKLIALNENFEPIKDWGPRPKIAQELVVTLRANPETKDTYANDLHKWYAKDKQNEIEKELFAFIASTLT